MRKTSFILLAGMVLALVSVIPTDVRAEEPGKKQLDAPVAAVKPHPAPLILKGLHLNDRQQSSKSGQRIFETNFPIFESWESQNGLIDLRKHYPRKTAEKRLQKTLGIDGPQLKFHYGPGPRVYYIDGLQTSQLGYRLQQLNAP
ncbi:hypothetical protein [Gimesia sp.]|uniref:hypothetical protein n=1 Tax=Gimesia sp. TaxID=2024833 RepID=UPI003A8DC6A5